MNERKCNGCPEEGWGRRSVAAGRRGKHTVKGNPCMVVVVGNERYCPVAGMRTVKGTERQGNGGKALVERQVNRGEPGRRK